MPKRSLGKPFRHPVKGSVNGIVIFSLETIALATFSVAIQPQSGTPWGVLIPEETFLRRVTEDWIVKGSVNGIVIFSLETITLATFSAAIQPQSGTPWGC
jgi:hypothetical protein